MNYIQLSIGQILHTQGVKGEKSELNDQSLTEIGWQDLALPWNGLAAIEQVKFRRPIK